ncbi:Platelet glycoprotein V like protein [Argiope bruennichi]|uniref:Platelet glycoprotein V like protein n=1 Tax=Argiope bruennichi TaxID=94029 RepID=A0A8T0E4W0_ARGBR|nr:Platelet glycoprotein V like protein [Argiope bruennichi]
MLLSGYGNWFAIYIFITVAVPVFRVITAECPPENLIKPCNCVDMPFTLVECGGITEMETLVRVFERTADRKFHSFALHNSTLQFLPASAISAKQFEQILLVNVTMTAMFDKRPDPSNNISMITIMQSKLLRGVGWENFGNLKKLQTIAIHDTEVKSLGKSFVDNVRDSLRRFHLYDSRVRKLQYNVFSHLTALYDLQVQNADIKSLKRTLFSTPTAECPPEALIKPCLCENIPFPLVECGGITEMETLVRVFERTADRKFHSFALHDSTLQFLPASAISAKKFEQLLLVNVTMTAMFDKRPDPSNNISMITIMHSKFLRGIGWENFGNLKKLKIISIHDTEVKSLGKSFVDNVSDSLRRFHLYDSRIRKLQYNAFSHLTALYDLQVQNADIKSLRSDNQIETLPDDLFTKMPHLEYINLSGNKISTISQAVFGDVYNTIKELKMERMTQRLPKSAIIEAQTSKKHFLESR